jgi:heptosyltransferase-2
MARDLSPDSVRRVLIVMPSWLGDTVMATPTLRALRRLYPQAEIAACIRRNLTPIVTDTPWLDRIITFRPRGTPGPAGRARSAALCCLSRRLRAGRFDLVVLLPNSFRTALLARLASIPRRIGYAREGRGVLLTDRLHPPRHNGRLTPVSTRDYYLAIAQRLGAVNPSPAMQLFTRPGDDARADELLRRAGYDPAGPRPLVLLNPGANYGDAKMWPAERFAALADRCVTELDAIVAISGAPNERAILALVNGAAKHPLLDLPELGVDLRLLKSVVKRARVMVTNDTGPRHMAAALGVPVVTIFGPTDPAWTEIHFRHERQVAVPVPCGPCQLKKCPLDHRCMLRIEPEMVFQRVAELIGSSG